MAETCEIKFLKCFGKNVIRTLNENIARFSEYGCRGYLCDPYLQPIAPTADRDRVKKLGKSVLAVAEAGVLFLTQKRHDDFDYEYMAVKK